MLKYLIIVSLIGGVFTSQAMAIPACRSDQMSVCGYTEISESWKQADGTCAVNVSRVCYPGNSSCLHSYIMVVACNDSKYNKPQSGEFNGGTQAAPIGTLQTNVYAAPINPVAPAPIAAPLPILNQ